MLRPFDASTEYVTNNESDFSDIKCIIKGLIEVFINKIYKLPSFHAIKIYKTLVTFLEMHYTKPKMFENCNVLRKMVKSDVSL